MVATNPVFENTDVIEGAGGHLPLMSNDARTNPRIPITLLAETGSWGAGGFQGVAALEDVGRFAIGNRRAGPALFIASPTDPLTGRSVPYSLEPFLPTLAYGGGGVGFPSDTPLTFTAPEPATLSITLSTPSRANQRLLASAASRPYFTARGALGFPTEPGFSGPNRQVGLTASDLVDDLNDPSWPATVVEFEETGLHRVSVSGELITLWGPLWRSTARLRSGSPSRSM